MKKQPVKLYFFFVKAWLESLNCTLDLLSVSGDVFRCPRAPFRSFTHHKRLTFSKIEVRKFGNYCSYQGSTFIFKIFDQKVRKISILYNLAWPITAVSLFLFISGRFFYSIFWILNFLTVNNFKEPPYGLPLMVL